MYFNSHQPLRLVFLIVVCVIYTFEDSRRFLSYQYTGSHQSIIDRYYAKRKDWKTSNLGTIMFKNVPPERFRRKPGDKRTYIVLTWGIFKSDSENRHRTYYTKRRMDPLAQCSVKNCVFTTNESLINETDVVVIATMIKGYPKVNHRNEKQKWVIWTNENPLHMMPQTKTSQWKPNMEYFASVANLTMSYRTDSDVPVPFGRTVPLPERLMSQKRFDITPLAEIIPNWTIKRHDVLAGVILRHHAPCRMKPMKDLSKYMEVDMYGGIATNKSLKTACPGNFNNDCNLIAQYLFYLAFENGRCHQYITEKTFHYAYSKGAIPVILGAPLKDCEELLPPNSYIHVDQFASIEELATHIKKVAKDYVALRGYHRWRNHFAVVNEHGFCNTATYHFCRLCEAHNYNERDGHIFTENDFKYYFDPYLNCNSLDVVDKTS